MTFQPTFRCTFSPTFDRRNASGGAWWNLFGAIPNVNVVAAYQAKGAASLAASYVNLANPGTYDCTTSNAPTLDSTNGWMFNGSSNILATGITSARGMLIICRYSNANTGDTLYIFGEGVGRCSVGITSGSGWRFYYGDGGYFSGTPATSGVIAIGANPASPTNSAQYYINGSPGGTFACNSFGAASAMTIGGATTNYAQVYVQAAAVYSTISAAQVAALSTAMAAL